MATSNNESEESHISDHDDQNVDRAQSSHSDQEGNNVVDSDANAHHESEEHNSAEESYHHSSSDEVGKRKRSKTLSKKRERPYSDSSGRSSDSEMDSNKRRKRHRRPTHKKKRRVHTSSSESSSTSSGMSSDSEADSNSSGYEVFNLDSEDEGNWRLSSDQKEYMLDKFTKYVPERKVKKITKECPKPDHKFLRTPDLDSDLEEGLDQRLGKQAKYTRAYDNDLARIQAKVLRTTGPLGRMWVKLSKLRKKKATTTSVKPFLKLTEQALTLVGQANNALLFSRRMNVLGPILNDKKQAQRKLNKYSHMLSTNGKMFGNTFQQKMVKSSTSDKSLLSLGRDKKPFRRGPPHRAERGGKQKAYYDNRESRYHNKQTDFRTNQFQESSRGYRSRGGRGGNYRGRGRGDPQPNENRSVQESSHSNGNSISRSVTGTSRITFTGSRSKSGKIKQTSGRKDKTLPPKLAKNLRRSSCATDCDRSGNRMAKQTTTFNNNKRSNILTHRKQPDRSRNQNNARQRGNTCNKTIKPPIHRPHIPKTKERRGNETSVQHESTKSIYPVQTLQDGKLGNVKNTPPETRLHDQSRPKGCLLLHSNMQKRPTISPIPVEKQTLPILMPTIRADISTTTIHKIDEANSIPVKEDRHKAADLPRRPTDPQSKQGATGERCQLTNIPSSELGASDKLGEISSGTDTGTRIPGNANKLKHDGTQSSPDKVARHTIQVQTNAGSGHYNSAQISSINRNTDSNNASDTPRPPVLPRNANAQNKTITSLANILCENHTNPQMQGRTQMVAPPHGDLEWQSNNEPRPRHDHPDGCQLEGLGSLSRGQTGIIRDKWPLVGDRDQTANKLPRTEGSGAGGAIICEEQGVHPRSSENGQHYSPNAYQQDGGHQITITNTNDEIPLGILLDEEDTPHSRISPGKQEQDSRCPVTTIQRLEQLETRSTTVHGTQQSVGTTGNGFVCRQTECPDHKILQLETRPAGSRYRRFPLAVEREVLCISSVLPDRQMPYESEEGTDRVGLDRSSMAGPTLVSNTPEHVDRRTDPLTSAQEHLIIPKGGGTPNDPEQQPPLSGMASFREANKNAGLSEKASQLLIKGWRKGTRTAYDAAWNRWASWCNQREIDPVQATVADVTEFLTNLYEDGLQYSTINGYRSAISSIHPLMEGHSVGKHPIITKIMAGVFNERPPTPKYNHTWDVNTVLHHFKAQEANDKLSIKELTHKLTMLLALTSAGRASELQSLNTKYMQHKGTTIHFTLEKPSKTTRQGQKLPTIVLHKYDKDDALDVVGCLDAYLNITRPWRLNAKFDRLLLSTVSPHKPVATSTISNWLKAVLKTVGIDTAVYTGHSTRSATTSKAKQVGVSVADIINRANWARASTFHKFYHKDTSSNQNHFSNAILDIDQ